MANSYYWEIKTMDVIPSLNEYTYVVDRVSWRYNGIDNVTNNTSYVGWDAKLSGSTDNTFVEYSALTQNIVEQWLENILDVNELKTMVDEKIEKLNNPPIIQPPLPWE
jgi:hypothetical protein